MNKWLVVFNFEKEDFVLPKKADPLVKLFAKNWGLGTKVDYRDYDTNIIKFW